MNTSFFLTNNVLVFPRILTHKSGWNGTICTNALTHECNPSNLNFRRNFCAATPNPIPACNHMHLFDAYEPYLKVRASQLPMAHIDTLEQVFKNQIMLFHSFAPKGYEVLHQVHSNTIPSTMIGFYRIEKIVLDPANSDFYKIHPYKDGWVRFPKLVSRQYYWLDTSDRMQNVKSLSSIAFKEILSYMMNSEVSYHDDDDEKRLRNAWEKVDDWLKVANDNIDQANKLLNEELEDYRKTSTNERLGNNAFEKLKNISVPSYKDKVATTTTPTIHKPAKHNEQFQWEEAVKHLSEKLQAQFHLAWHSKPLIILSGEPGCGKSQIARNLVSPQHRCIVSVSSAFTSQEDLFGYYNPVNAKFHGTRLVSFLIQCEKDWLKGDRTTRVIVLEEMNIAQPEHYMSDILTKTQYPEDDIEARTIDFPGSEIEGHPNKNRVMLSPAIKFVATVNIDHSVRKLTQRILDRSAIVKIEISPSTILSHLNLDKELASVELVRELETCLSNLNTFLDGRYRFSYRTGESLSTALAIRNVSTEKNKDQKERLAFQALDLVLVQEVWPRVSSSLRSDFHPERVLEELTKWVSEYTERDLLKHSGEILTEWNMRFEQGNNIDTMGI